MKNRLIVLLTAVALAFAAGCADQRITGGGTDTETGWVAGIITKDGAGLGGVTVTLSGGKTYSDITASDGTYGIDNVAYGEYSLNAYISIDGDGVYQYDVSGISVNSDSTNLGVRVLTRTGATAKR